MMRTRSPLFRALLGVACALPVGPAVPDLAWAQSLDWVSLGPEGGDVTALAVDPRNPRRVFAGLTQAGIYRSDDYGASWQRANGGLAAYYVNAVVLDPVTAGVVYAATDYGLYQSTDHGAAWTLIPHGLSGPEAAVSAMAVDPSTPATIMIGSNTSRLGEATKLRRTTNGGASWAEVSLPVQEASVWTIAFDPRNPDNVYVGTGCCAGGVFKSVDRGLIFSLSSTGLSTPLIWDIVPDPVTDGVVYAATALGLNRSVNGGAEWTLLSGGLPGESIGTFGVDPVNSSRLYASVDATLYRSTNSGDAWATSSTGLGSTPIASLAVTPTEPDRVYVGTLGRGVFGSTNGGGSWTPRSRGLVSSRVQAVAVDPANASAIWIGTGTDGQKSDDRGATWTPLGLTSAVRGILFDPTTPRTAYAIAGGVLMKTTDRGATWNPRNSGLPALGIEVVVMAPSLPTTLYASKCGEGVFRSTDGADTWVNLGGETVDRCVQYLAVDPSDPDVVFASAGGGWVNDSMLFSENGGDTFASIDNGLPGLIPGAVVVEPTTPRRAYLGFIANSGLYTTVDDGASWTQLPNLPGSVRNLVVDVPRSTVWAATEVGVFRSSDHGVNWENMSVDLPAVSPSRLALGRDQDVIYLGTGSDGLFVLRTNQPDGGADAGGIDSGEGDAGQSDAGEDDAGEDDAQSDAGSDGGSTGEVDGGLGTDAESDAGTSDAAPTEDGSVGPAPDGGVLVDDGSFDERGEASVGALEGSCSCDSSRRSDFGPLSPWTILSSLVLVMSSRLRRAARPSRLDPPRRSLRSRLLAGSWCDPGTRPSVRSHTAAGDGR